MSGIRPAAMLSLLFGAVGIGIVLNAGNSVAIRGQLDNVEQKIETVDSTLKSWDAAMKPMVAEANAKKTLVIKNFSDSTARVAKQHQIDSLENVVRQMKKVL